MKKTNKHIEIVRSSTPSLSSMGGKSCDMIRTLLERYYTQVGVTTVNDIRDLDQLIARQPDLVFLGVKRLPVDADSAATVWLSAYLDARGLNYTGSTAAAITLDYNKPAAKQVVKIAGLATAAHFVAQPGQYHSTEELPVAFPLFIKPPNGGGGQGIGADSVVRDFAGYQQKVQATAEGYGTDALAESYLPGREFSVAILENTGTDELTAMPIELIAGQNSQGDRILGQAVKTADTEQVIAVTDEAIRQPVVELATKVFRALGARDYGRIDIRLDERGVPHFLEANLIPGLAQHDFTSYFTSACLINQSMDYQAMILHIVALGLVRDSRIGKMELDVSTMRSAALLSLKTAFAAK